MNQPVKKYFIWVCDENCFPTLLKLNGTLGDAVRLGMNHINENFIPCIGAYNITIKVREKLEGSKYGPVEFSYSPFLNSEQNLDAII